MSVEPLKFQDKYRVKSSRLPFHDYGSNGAYFVTICTKHKEPWFGEIQKGVMCLSDLGQIAAQCWLQIPQHFNFVKLGEWIVMPDHMHGIIEIDKPDVLNVERDLYAGRVETPNLGVSTWAPAKLGVIINQYKRAVTIQSRKTTPDFIWQPRFHDRVIRTQKEHNKITDYIRFNPKNKKDALSGVFM